MGVAVLKEAKDRVPHGEFAELFRRPILTPAELSGAQRVLIDCAERIEEIAYLKAAILLETHEECPDGTLRPRRAGKGGLVYASTIRGFARNVKRKVEPKEYR